MADHLTTTRYRSLRTGAVVLLRHGEVRPRTAVRWWWRMPGWHTDVGPTTKLDALVDVSRRHRMSAQRMEWTPDEEAPSDG